MIRNWWSCGNSKNPQRLLRRPERVGWNLGLTLLLIAGMIAAKLDPVAVFMVGVVMALQINYPNLSMQRERIDAHSRAALMMAGIILAAGAFTGIMKESGMLNAMAASAVAFAPGGAARHLPFVLGLVSMPLSVVFDPDSFYFGMLPVLSQTAAKFGVEPVQMAQGALLGLHTTGFPVSPLTPAPFLAGRTRGNRVSGTPEVHVSVPAGCIGRDDFNCSCFWDSSFIRPTPC